MPDLIAGPLRLDPNKRQADCHGERLDLTPKEYAILEALIRRRGQIVSRTLLWETVWESHSEPNSNVVDVNVGYLRRKLGSQAELIKTVRGAGYMLEETD